MAEAEALDVEEMRVIETTPIEGDHDDFEVIVRHTTEHHGDVEHRFVFEYFDDGAWDLAKPRALYVAWEPRLDDSLFLADLEVVGYVEQYLQHHGIETFKLLDDGMYRYLDVELTNAFTHDVKLDFVPS
ncbi:hypothetical protein ACFQH6_19635 [Halobacteriaceae archaeon GCM10025711]